MIETEFATIERTSWGCISHFHDGSRFGAHPHDVPHYHAAAHRYGYQGDIFAYAVEHELAHHLVAEAFGHRSRVIWALAHGKQPDPEHAAAEEALAMTLQRYARTNEVPLIEGIDWDALRTKLLKARIV